MIDIGKEREAFEAWITAPPFEKDVSRRPELSAWPWTYRDYSVEMAWASWQARAAVNQQQPTGLPLIAAPEVPHD